MNNKIDSLIVSLLAIANFAKDIHYNCKGEAFYSKHLLCDRVSDNLYNFMDDIKEVCFMAAGKSPLASADYLRLATEQIPELQRDDIDNFLSLNNLLLSTLEKIEDIKGLTKGEENIIGAIAQDLQTSLALINSQIKE